MQVTEMSAFFCSFFSMCIYDPMAIEPLVAVIMTREKPSLKLYCYTGGRHRDEQHNDAACFFNSSNLETTLWQYMHSYLLTLCLSICCLKSLYLSNCTLHDLQKYGFPRAWWKRCFLRFAVDENPFQHNLQTNGFSPVCMWMWFFRSREVKNLLLHRIHSNGRSPVWKRICVLRLIRNLNFLSHSWHS